MKLNSVRKPRRRAGRKVRETDEKRAICEALVKAFQEKLKMESILQRENHESVPQLPLSPALT